MFNFGLGRSYNKPCFGHRPINPVTGELESFYVWQSYKDVDRRRTEFGSGLMRLQAEGKLGTSDQTGWTLGIWTHNRPGTFVLLTIFQIHSPWFFDPSISFQNGKSFLMRAQLIRSLSSLFTRPWDQPLWNTVSTMPKLDWWSHQLLTFPICCATHIQLRL